MMLAQICRFGYPENVDPDRCTQITSFSSDRGQWMNSKCINIHDSQSPVYELTDEYDGRKAVVKNFFMLLSSYQNHPEAKSLGPEGEHKNIADDRVVQIPGPPAEVACVREIYRLFLEENMSFTAIARELDRREIRYPNRTTWNPWAVKNILAHPKYVGVNQVQGVIASYTRNRTNNHLLEDLKSILAKEGKLNSCSIRAHGGAASLTTYVSRFGSISRAIRQTGYQCRVTEESLQKDRKIQAIRAKLMEDIVLASAGRVRIDDRKNYRFRTCLRVKSSRQLVAAAVARCYKGYRGSDRWRIRCLRNERNLVILLARVNETNDCILDLIVIPPLRKGNQVSVHRDDRRFASVIRLTDLGDFEAAVKVISSRTESMNWSWYEPPDALATKQQLARIERACKNDLIWRGMNQKTLERIRKGRPVRASKLTKCMVTLEKLEGDTTRVSALIKK